jgi:transcriptional regulator with XRE-family HTH domain
MVDTPEPFHDALRAARARAGVSQLTLALSLGVSQRHVSFVENGRSRPSRELLAAWLEALDLPLATRNSLTLRAGFAPVFREGTFADPELQHAHRALQLLLDTHDPYPCFIVDEQWNLVNTNRGGRWLAAELCPWVTSLVKAPNMFDLLLHPDGMLARVQNLREVGPQLLSQLRREEAANPALAPAVHAFATRLRDLLGELPTGSRVNAAADPMMTTRFATSVGVLSFFSMFTTFGTPYDITLASIRVEHLFPADADTAAVLRSRVT